MALRNKRHQAFVDEYFLCNMNQTKAYLKVYPDSSRESARANAARLIATDSVSEEIENRLKEKHLSADEVLARLGDMARGDIADFVEVDRPADLAKEELRGKTHIIKKFKRSLTRGRDGTEYENTELELYDAQTALIQLGRNHGLFTDKIELKLEKEMDAVLAIAEKVLDADSYQRLLQALTGNTAGGPEAPESGEDS